MARIRTIKPEFWSDYKLAEELTRDQRLLYIGLWNEADDEGRFLAHPRRLLGVVFPYDRDLNEQFIEESFRALSETGRLTLYEIDGEPYGQLTKFNDHQRINRPTPSKIPPPPRNRDPSPTPHGEVTEPSSPRARAPEVEQGTGNREQDPPGVARAREASPDPEPVDDPEVGEEIEPESLALVPGDLGDRVIPIRPAAGDLPFATQDWEGRTSGNVVLREWINLQPTKPSQSDRDRFGRVCRKLADEHSVGELALAFIGMGCIWPYAPPPIGEDRTWTPEDLKRDFVKALPAARNHPQLKAARWQQEFDEALAGGGW